MEFVEGSRKPIKELDDMSNITTGNWHSRIDVTDADSTERIGEVNIRGGWLNTWCFLVRSDGKKEKVEHTEAVWKNDIFLEVVNNYLIERGLVIAGAKYRRGREYWAIPPRIKGVLYRVNDKD